MIVAVLVLAPSYDGYPRLSLFGPHPSLTLTPLAAPTPSVTGRLTWLGGVRLDSDDGAFGGFSAMAVQGKRLTLLNDGGNFVAFDLAPDWKASNVRFGALPDGPRTGWEKRDRDSESLAVGSDGRMWVGFESGNMIWRYAPGFARAEGSAAPRAIRRWEGNGGMEALARLRDGRFVAIAERSRWPGKARVPGTLAALVFAGDPVAAPDRGFGFSYRPAPGHSVSDMALLPNGDLLVLERRWLLPLRFRSRLALVRAAALKPGAVVTGRELGRVTPPWPTENYEGVAVTREGKALIVWLVSDNDQYWWRPSYLLKLRLN